MTSKQPQTVAQAARDRALAAEQLKLDLQELELNPGRLDTAKIYRNKLRNTPLLPGSVSERARLYRLERLEKQHYEKEREKERQSQRFHSLNTGNLAKPPAKESAEDIVAGLSAYCDELIGDYRHLPEKMGYNRKKVVKTSDLKPLNPSRSKGKGKTAAVPKNEKWMTEGHLFSTKSKLPEIDLHAYLAKPESWNVLNAEEKATIRALLPETTPYNPDGSPSANFLNHNTDWRNGIRQFQEDVQTGRMDPEWQADAAGAMEERAAGDFDDFKEQQYEAFWGQKAELPQHVLSGDASRVRLEELVQAGVFKVGDVWSYTRAFGRRKAALIEKEVTIGQIQNGLLVFLIPPAQHKYMPARFQMNIAAAASATFMEDAEETMSDYGTVLHENPSEYSTLLQENPTSAPNLGAPLPSATTPGPTPLESPTLGHILACETLPSRASPAPSSPKRKPLPLTLPPGPLPASAAPTTIYSSPTYTSTTPPPVVSKIRIFAVPSPGSLGDPSHPQILRVKRLHGLERKILEIDGRAQYDGKESSWRYLRCVRDGRDMGSLWEVREEFYERVYGFGGKGGPGRATSF